MSVSVLLSNYLMCSPAAFSSEGAKSKLEQFSLTIVTDNLVTDESLREGCRLINGREKSQDLHDSLLCTAPRTPSASAAPGPAVSAGGSPPW